MDLQLLSEIERSMETPTARGLASAVLNVIQGGHLKEGDKLPPIRSVALQLGLSPTTVSSAWARLQRAGVVVTAGREGTRIALRDFKPRRYRNAPTSGAPTEVYGGARPQFALDLSTGSPDAALLPPLAASLNRVGSTPVSTSYLDEFVLPDLLKMLRATWPFPADQLTVVDGALDALQLIVTTHLRLGDRVGVEDPCFPPVLDLLNARGAIPIPIRLDDAGLSLSGAHAAAKRGVRAMIIQPCGQNPTGVSMTAERRDQLASMLASTEVLVIEDDSLGPIATRRANSLGLRLPGQTLHIRSYSKSHGPDLRLAALGGPDSLMAPIIDRRFLGQGWTSRLLQRLLADLLTDTSAVRAVDHARHEYARRRRALIDHLSDEGIQVAEGDGLNIWVPVANQMAAMLVLAAAGIGVSSGRTFAVDLDEQPPHVRITVGLVASDFAELASTIARAAKANQPTHGR